MSDKPKVYVAGVGMITPVGANAEMTAAAVRAGVNAYREAPSINKDGKPMTMALIPEDALPPLKNPLAGIDHLMRITRLLCLATPAIGEATASLPLKEPPPLFLAAPESIPGCSSMISSEFLDHLIVQTDVRIDRSMSRLLATGRSGGLQAIDLAFKYFESTGKDIALVGGVDTYLDHFLLGALDNQIRILAEDVVDGFAPGEAAGFLLLVSARVVNKLPHKPKAALYAPGLANESGHRYSQEAYRGDGLANAFRLAIEQSNGEAIGAIYGSLNGEQFGTKELGVASLRNKAAFSENVRTEHPADCFGDIGAAFGPILIGLMSMNKPGTYLGYCSSEQQGRSAIVVQTL